MSFLSFFVVVPFVIFGPQDTSLVQEKKEQGQKIQYYVILDDSFMLTCHFISVRHQQCTETAG